MHPAGEVQPVQVNPDATIEALADALEALGLFGDDLLDPEWLAGEAKVSVADGGRLRGALERYRELAAAGDLGDALRRANCPADAPDALAGFFGFVEETGGGALVIEHLT